MHGQGLLHPFAQTPRRTRIEIHQFAMQLIQRLLSSDIVFQQRIESFRHPWFLFVGQMISTFRRLCTRSADAAGRRGFSRLR